MEYSFFDTFQDGVLVVDQSCAVKFVNASFATMTGLSQKRIVNKNIRELMILSPETIEQVNNTFTTRSSTPFLETELLGQGQERRRVQIGTSPIEGNLVLISIHDVSVEETLQKKYKREFAEKEKYIDILNRKIFELEFMLDLMSFSATDDSIEPYPDKSFQRIQKALQIEFILILNRGGDMQSSDIEISAAYTPESIPITNYTDLINSTITYWRTVDLNKVGAETPCFIRESDGYSVVTSLVKGKQQQWKVFLFFFSRPRSQHAVLNKSLLASLSQQIYLMIENQSLFHLAVTDEKTQIYNARYFTYRLENEIVRAKRYKSDVSLLVIDIDFFKKFNDTYGHLVGDFVLRQVARALKSVFRGCDVIARFGGEEFVVFCPETNKAQAILAAERARKAVEKLSLEVSPGKTASVTVSIGVSTYPFDTEEIPQLTKFADEALYEAKKLGRNRVECYKNEGK